jgi:hypothetical protein
MSKFKFSPEFLDQLRELAVRWGKTAAERATAEVGSNLTMDFRDVEQLAALIAAGVTEGTVTTLLDKQAHALGEQPCPACGTCCPVNYLDRPLTLETGQIISMHEPICHCPKCRRDFFPPPDLPASGRTRVQPRRPEDAR